MCPPNFYFYPDGSCNRCQEGLYEHTDGTCSKCQDGLYEHTNGSCHKCKEGLFAYTNGACEACPQETYQYPDSSCKLTCSYPYVENRTETSLIKCVYYVPSPSQQAIENLGKGTQTAGSAAAQVVSALASGSPGGVMISVAGRIFSLIKYLNISRSNQLENALQNWKSNFIPIDFDFILPSKVEENVVYRPVPEIFAKRDTKSSFLINCWDTVMFLCLILIIYLFLQLALKVTNQENKVFRVLKSLIIGVQNFLLTQLYALYGDIVFYVVLEFRSFKFEEWSSDLSFSIAVVLIIVMFLSFAFHLSLLYNYQKAKLKAKNPAHKLALRKYQKEHQGVRLLFGDFKDNSLIQQAFLLILTSRDILFSLIVTTLFENTLLQIIFIIILNILIIIYLVIKRPFRALFDEVQQFTYEIIIFCTVILELFGAILDKTYHDDSNLRTSLGSYLIALNLILNMIGLFYMSLKLIFMAYDAYKAYQDKQKKANRMQANKVSPMELNTINKSHLDSELALNINSFSSQKSQANDLNDSTLMFENKNLDLSRRRVIRNNQVQVNTQPKIMKRVRGRGRYGIDSIFPVQQRIIMETPNALDFEFES